MQPNFHYDPMAGTNVYTFIQACINSLDRANELLLSDPSLLQQRTRLGETPLHFLAVENQIEALKWLSANGAVIETINRFGDTPLSDVASLGYLDLVQFLLESGADVNHKSHTGDFVVHESVRSGNPEIVDLVIQY